MTGNEYLLLNDDDRRSTLLGAMWLAAQAKSAATDDDLLAIGRQVGVDERTRQHVEAFVTAAIRADANVDLFENVAAAMEAKTLPSTLERSLGPDET